jgi:colicin import membrane protein
MFALSFVCHLAIFAFIVWGQILPAFHEDEAPVTYVDMVTLPVASPQSGTPAQAAPAAPAPPAPAPPEAMALPAPKPKVPAKVSEKAPPTPKAKGEKPAPPSEAREFSERMAKLERLAEEKRQSEVLDRLRNQAKGGRVGMPGAKGTEAGSDYSSYLQSRLKDAFREVMTSQTKSPQVIATITVGTDGRIAEYHVEKNSGDPLFDDAVARAVTLAGASLKPPPGGKQFKRIFRFKPEGVGVR